MRGAAHAAAELHGGRRRRGSAEVAVGRIAYHARAHSNLCPADGALNLPAEKGSPGLRVALGGGAERGCYEDAHRPGSGWEPASGRSSSSLPPPSSRNTRQPTPAPDDVLDLSCDGKGVVMRSDALRETTAKGAARTAPKLKALLSGAEKPNRARIAVVGAVCSVTLPPHTSTEVLAPAADNTLEPPRAANRWRRASVVNDAADVIAPVFNEAEHRGTEHPRTWVGLVVDGNKRWASPTIRLIWCTAWCCYKERDPAAETRGQKGQTNAP